MKKKYLLLADGKSPHTLKWMVELVKYFDVYIISLNGISNEINTLLPNNNIYVLNEAVKSSGGNYWLVLKTTRIVAILKQIQPQFVNAHYISSYGFIAALCKLYLKKFVLIQTAWGSDILRDPFINYIRKLLTQFALKHADLITTDSLYISDQIAILVHNKEVETFAFGFEKIEDEIYNKENLLFSNRALESLYKIDQILYWFAKQKTSCRLVIANSGQERNRLEELAHNLAIVEKVTFVGYLSSAEQVEYYKKAKFYISIPETDATSVSLLEAMQYGALPIVSNIPANREWVLDGINGFFFDFDLDINNLMPYKDFFGINQILLNNKAVFPKNIAYFIKRIQTYE